MFFSVPGIAHTCYSRVELVQETVRKKPQFPGIAHTCYSKVELVQGDSEKEAATMLYRRSNIRTCKMLAFFVVAVTFICFTITKLYFVP